ncbi:hypothetical protein [Endozoicomonas sp. 4G]|uniref:hypothetical protein n=1 Tax=Endozoicomonas sp. 4G TaxID=2872754 RepID=UPI0020787ABA|nr:hypothetical protein [Endozoicomonas sp. 4G]
MKVIFRQKEITIVYSNEFLGDEKHVWNMIIERTARESDLEENHYLEQIYNLANCL